MLRQIGSNLTNPAFWVSVILVIVLFRTAEQRDFLGVGKLTGMLGGQSG